MPHSATLRLIERLPDRRPAASVPTGLSALFHRLARTQAPDEALRTEEHIWSAWMAHPNSPAEAVLDRATSDIAAQRHDIAETRLVSLLRACPDYAEAWHKLGTLYYLLTRDEESLACLHRALEFEPRHFGALSSAGEILAGDGDQEGAALAFHAALRLHPHLAAVRTRLQTLRPHA